MPIYSNCDHNFYTLGVLGQAPDDPFCAGDFSTWGDGALELAEINVFSPMADDEGETTIYIGKNSVSYKADDIEFAELAKFIRDNVNRKLSDDEVDFILYAITEGNFGEDNYIISSNDLDEWPLDDLMDELDGDELNGRLFLHGNTRYDAESEVDGDGNVEWLDEVDPDDDAQRVLVFKTF
jgi:hypothetical protein